MRRSMVGQPGLVMVMRAAALTLGVAGLALSATAQVQPTKPGEAGLGKPDLSGPEFQPPAPNKERPAETKSESDPETPSIVVSRLILRYAFDHPELPSLDDVMKTEVTLGRVGDGYVSPGPDVETETFLLEDIGLRPASKFTSKALEEVARAVVRRMNELGIVGVRILPNDREFGAPEENDPAWGKDLRKGKTQLTMGIQVGLVSDVRTLAFGDRIPFEERVNARQHDRIREGSPVQAYSEDDPARTDVISKDMLDEYIFRLNRHPGRRVDTAVAPGDRDGYVTLDYLVSENRPWYAYFQISNTGTKSTNEWRERFGFAHNQLTSNDDILTLDYTTAGFDSSHSVAASYDRPLWGDWLRGKVFGNYSIFQASDVGRSNEEFEGESYTIGGELSANIYQHRAWFVDAFVGLRYMHAEIDQTTLGNSGSNNFLLPSIGLRLERSSETASTNASISVDYNLSGTAGTGGSELNVLRTNADKDFTILQWDFSQTFYLEPLFRGENWRDASNQTTATLAHEIALAFRGQYAFDDRLIPNMQQVAGGMYTVRGYPESAVAGDTVYLASAEYRVHLPQAFGFNPTPGTLFGEPFRWQPQQAFGRADWDLILKGFVDVGRTENSRRLSFEQDDNLVGAGLGVDLLFKRNLSLRLDWGVALEELKGENQVDAGSNRFHFVATILF